MKYFNFIFILIISANFLPGYIDFSRNSGFEPDLSLASTPKQEMVLIKGGTFSMGSADGDQDEKPVHQVVLNDYYLDKYEVTSDKFCEFLNVKGNQSEGGATWINIQDEDCTIEYKNGKYVPKRGMAKNPVVVVTWFGAHAYCKWIGKRLPTEAEWEYAARGGKKAKGFKYAGSNQAHKVAWFDDNSDGLTYGVGKKLPNELGLYDMSGNVCEWCNDWYSGDYYKRSPGRNPLGPSGKLDYKVLRGGAWISVAKQIRVSARDYAYPYNAYNQNGFRCAMDAK
jgi:formylglycine-generating enzyme